MRGRIILITLIASTLILTGCRLSDQQRIGVLKFVANSITGAIDDSGAGSAAVIAAPQAQPSQSHVAIRQELKLKLCSLGHAVSRVRHARIQSARASVQQCRLQVKTIPARLILSFNVEALRRLITGEATTVVRKCCPRSTPAVRS